MNKMLGKINEKKNNIDFFRGRQVFTENQFFNFSLHDNAYRLVIQT